VQVFGLSGRTAFEVGFTDISYTAPDPASFAFTPPAGSRRSAPDLSGRTPLAVRVRPGDVRGQVRAGPVVPPGVKPPSARPASTEPRWIGKGWTAVVELPETMLPGLFQQMASPVPGGRLLHTALLDVLRTDDGRVFAGAVTGSFLEHVASTTR
jgi:hypothetical protein